MAGGVSICGFCGYHSQAYWGANPSGAWVSHVPMPSGSDWEHPRGPTMLRGTALPPGALTKGDVLSGCSWVFAGRKGTQSHQKLQPALTQLSITDGRDICGQYILDLRSLGRDISWGNSPTEIKATNECPGYRHNGALPLAIYQCRATHPLISDLHTPLCHALGHSP